MNVVERDVVICPLVIEVCEDVEVEGPMRIENPSISGNRMSLPLAFTVYEMLKLLPTVTTEGAWPSKTTSSAKRMFGSIAAVRQNRNFMNFIV